MSRALSVYHPPRWKWWVAQIVNKLPRSCWCSLVDWIYDAKEDGPEEARRLRDCGQSTTCHSDLARLGTCYCGKLRDRS